jgi:hypothetical protein
MKWIALIVIVSVIALAVIIWKLIERYKSRQAEQLEHLRKLWVLGDSQLAVTVRALRTIRDLQGDSAFDAQMALDEIERLKDEHYNPLPLKRM